MMPKHIATKLTQVFEAVFADFQNSLDSLALHCENNDASQALYEVSSAIDRMDIGYVIREVLEVDHPKHGE